MQGVYFPAILTAGLIFLSLVWTLTDPRSFSERLRDYQKPNLLLFGIGSVATVLLNLLSFKFFPWSLGSLDEFLIVAGLVSEVLGIFIAVWAKLTMRKFWGLPAQLDVRRQNRLIKSGPFTFSRNPIYLGLILTIFGYSLALRSYFVLLTPLIYLYWLKAIKTEEKLLEKHFGKKYLQYKNMVPRFI